MARAGACCAEGDELEALHSARSHGPHHSTAGTVVLVLFQWLYIRTALEIGRPVSGYSDALFIVASPLYIYACDSLTFTTSFFFSISCKAETSRSARFTCCLRTQRAGNFTPSKAADLFTSVTS